MISKKIKIIIVDYGGVIINLGTRKTMMPRIIAHELNIPESTAIDLWYKNRQKLITGREKIEDFLKKINAISDNEISKLALKIRNQYRPKRKQINWDLLNYLDELKSKYRIYGFSNTVPFKPNKIQNEIDRHFISVFKSYLEGYVKPEKSAFKNILKKITARPEECLLIDDVDENIIMARKLGLQAIKFSNLPDLKRVIRNLSILNTH
jgi:putative hydrolase of the HAD superfamily